MLLVSWVLALVGGLLAFALAAGSAAGFMRRMDFYSALAVTPLPVLAIYLSAPVLVETMRHGWSLEDLVFPAGPGVIGFITLLGTFASFRQQSGGGRRHWS